MHLCLSIEFTVYLRKITAATMIYVSRKEHFNAAHKLYNPKWSREKNEEVFGPCANENWHGHNFEMIVTVKGKPDPDTGFVVDLKKLSNLIKESVIEKIDHKNLNVDVDFMKGKMASCEVLVEEIWKILAPAARKITPRGELYSIRLYETPNNFVEFFGEGLEENVPQAEFVSQLIC